MERGVAHAERLQDALLEKSVELLSADALDEVPQHVGRAAVFPSASWLKHQRHGRERFHEFSVRVIGSVHSILGVQVLHERLAEHAIGKPGGMPHQVLDRDRTLRRDELERAALLHADLQVLQFRNVLRNRIRELHATLFDEDHRRDRNDRLGHRVDAEDRVGCHGRAGDGILLSVRQAMYDPAIPSNEHDSARNQTFVHVGAHGRVKLLQALGREPARTGRRAWIACAAAEQRKR